MCSVNVIYHNLVPVNNSLLFVFYNEVYSSRLNLGQQAAYAVFSLPGLVFGDEVRACVSTDVCS